jgi:TatD DNase family protein
MLTDSHCHLASHRFPPDETADLILRAHDAGISRLVTLATCLDDVEPNLSIATSPSVHACIGIHPCDVHHAPDDATDKLSQYVSDPRVCAIGETGLDYYHAAPDGWEEEAFRTRQRKFLHEHFQLAAQAGLNLVIHTRDRVGQASFDDALKIYEEYHQHVRAVFHCFISTATNARRVLDLGGLVSFGGVATFKSAHEVRDTILSCPPGTFMLETDAPYLAPEPYRGKRNEPAFVARTAVFIASLRGEDIETLASHTNSAASSFFRFRA